MNLGWSGRGWCTQMFSLQQPCMALTCGTSVNQKGVPTDVLAYAAFSPGGKKKKILCLGGPLIALRLFLFGRIKVAL